MFNVRSVILLLSVVVLSSCKLEIYVVGEGSVSVSPAGQACTDSSVATHCYQYEDGANVLMTASPQTEYEVSSWSKAVCGYDETCNIKVSGDTQATVTFGLKDRDGDGVPNRLDAFPDDPTEWADEDKDRVGSNKDKCPSTTLGLAVDEDGCAENQLDKDNDGVTNDLDQCDNTPRWEDADATGCSLSQKDSDGDGVNDADDFCPNTVPPKIVDQYGCASTQTSSILTPVIDLVFIDPVLTACVKSFSQKNNWQIAGQVKTLNCEKESITNVAGIEQLVLLEKLDLSNNPVESVNLSKLLSLKRLVLWNTQLQALDLSFNRQLKVLDIHDNRISLLDLSKNLELQMLSLGGNEITDIAFEENKNLLFVDVRNNPLTAASKTYLQGKAGTGQKNLSISYSH